ncbi:hypothetical protein PLESTB_000765000 [Pleodorina starrii]|uniref:Gem-associated protein 2 n=1 Tax=Pleodorina starrii TaxID=330485 RepID=A0A9W6F292_9CHLO|nr:hypothetical protein PLESTM_000440300 [Pleodorina starrii]GLC53579.1 hypothetical protein PLESTB_000765000 [Pleodorina starrii]
MEPMEVSEGLLGASNSREMGSGTPITRGRDDNTGMTDEGLADYDDDADNFDEDEGEEEDEDEAMASSEDEDYNRTHFGISQALPVPDGPPDFDAGPPQTAEEYLQWVRFEASRCPRITRKDVDPAVLERHEQRRQQQNQTRAGDDTAAAAAAAGGPTSGGGGGGRRRGGGGGGGGCASAAQVPPPVTSECPEWARPSPKWLAVFLKDFCRLRQALGAMQLQHARELSATQLPSLDNTAAWDRLCFEQWQPLEQQQQQQEEGGKPAATSVGQEEDEQGTPPPPPPPPPPQEEEEEEEEGCSGGPAAAVCGASNSGGGGGSGGAAATGPHPLKRLHGGEQQRRQQAQPGSSAAGGGGGGGGGASLAAGQGREQAHGQGGETDRLCGPVVRTVLALDQVSVGSLIERHVAQLGSQSSLSYIRSQWLFALAAVLERPVPPDVAAAMRDLVRRCSFWRASLERSDDPVLPRLNVLLAVAGGYFGQDEQLSAAAAAAGLVDLV